MAIDKQTAPLDSPETLTDWQRVIDLTDTLALALKNPWPVKNDKIIRGSCFYIGGAWYVANVDVAISGTASDYIQMTVDTVNSLITPAYVSTLTDVTWNDQYNGWYDTTGHFYVFDENVAYGAGLIDFPRTVVYSRPKNAEMASILSTSAGENWSEVIAQDCNTDSVDQIIIQLPQATYPNYNRALRYRKTKVIVQGWSDVFHIDITFGASLGKINSFRIRWENEDSIDHNSVRIKYNGNVIVTWNDHTQKNVNIDITGLDIQASASFVVEYYDVTSSGFGVRTMAINAYASCVDDTNKPNILEYAFNAATLFLTIDEYA